MPTLLMCLDGPIQAWGVQSRFEIRETLNDPSKSGVVGLICAALGRDRSAPINDLAALRMGVRVDREGQMRRDYQTAVTWKRGRRSGTWTEGGTTLSTRYFLANAVFLVGLEGKDRGLLENIHQRLAIPHWPLCLGRKAYAPSRPVQLKSGLIDAPLEEALTNAPWLCESPDGSGGNTDGPTQLRLVIEAHGAATDGLVRQRRPDQPVSFQPRQFALREVAVRFIPRPQLKQEATHEPH